MDKLEFRKYCKRKGYFCLSETFSSWVKDNPKDDYTEEDGINLYRFAEYVGDSYNGFHASGAYLICEQRRNAKGLE